MMLKTVREWDSCLLAMTLAACTVANSMEMKDGEYQSTLLCNAVPYEVKGPLASDFQIYQFLSLITNNDPQFQ
jgi:hypothetical protein